MSSVKPPSLDELLAKAEAVTKTWEKRMSWLKLGESDKPIGWRKIFSRRYLLPNGAEKAFDISVHFDSACVLALTPDEQVVLVKQFRPGPERFTLELPGGLVDKGEEQPLEAIRREFLEETGFSGELEKVGQFLLGAYSTGQKHAFLATNCEWVQEQRGDDDEFIEVVLMPLEKFREWLDTADMVDTGCAYRALKAYDLRKGNTND